MIANPQKLHYTVMSETELIIDYSRSPIVTGDACSNLAAGFRLPDTIAVQAHDMPPRHLHELAHRAGHTLMLLGGPTADRSALVDLCAALNHIASNSPLFDATVAVSSHTGLPMPIARFDPSAAGLLGVEGITLLAMRPDGYIGLRSDCDHLAALERYSALVQTGSS